MCIVSMALKAQYENGNIVIILYEGEFNDENDHVINEYVLLMKGFSKFDFYEC